MSPDCMLVASLVLKASFSRMVILMVTFGMRRHVGVRDALEDGLARLAGGDVPPLDGDGLAAVLGTGVAGAGVAPGASVGVGVGAALPRRRARARRERDDGNSGEKPLRNQIHYRASFTLSTLLGKQAPSANPYLRGFADRRLLPDHDLHVAP